MATAKIIEEEKNSRLGGDSLSAASQPDAMELSGRWKPFLWATAVLTICFSLPLWHLARFAWEAELYSYILLVPFICWYLVGQKKSELPADSEPARGAGLAFLLTGTGG